jgi:glutathione S-transferase
MKLYWHPVSLMPWRVRIALAEKSLDYEEVVIDLPGGASHRPEFLALNPFGQVPVLEDGGRAFAESTAILEYLEETHPRPALMPAAADARAEVRQLMCWSNGPWMMSWKRWVAPASLGFPDTAEVRAQGRAELDQHLALLVARLERTPWLAGDYSLADICYAPLVLMAGRMGLSAEGAGQAAIDGWLDRLRARPAVQAAMGPILG